MKLCKDCRHYSNAFPGEPQNARCLSPKRISHISRVDGQPQYSVNMCETARDSEMHCGHDAKWFEPRVVKSLSDGVMQLAGRDE